MASLNVTRPIVVEPSGLKPVEAICIQNRRITDQKSRNGPQFDAEGLFAAPGYIDLQINGGFGIDLWSDPSAIWDLGRRLPETGATAFYPTLISPSPEQIAVAQLALGNRPTKYVGAEPLGLHLEGPMLSPLRAGVHRPDSLRDARPEVTAGWTADTGIGIVTLAPELPGALEVINELVAAGVVVSAGHSQATAEESAAAERVGLTMVTHLFNAMGPLHHREPGLVGHTLTSRELRAGLIADGHHVDPAVIKLAWRMLGPDRLALVSDAVAGLGSPPGATIVAGEPAIADSHTVRSRTGSGAGSLAGARACLAVGVRNLHYLGGADLPGAIGAATKVPAQIMGLQDRGHLGPGARGDIVLLNETLNVAATFCGGQLAYLEPGFEERLSD